MTIKKLKIKVNPNKKQAILLEMSVKTQLTRCVLTDTKITSHHPFLRKITLIRTHFSSSSRVLLVLSTRV